ncbi:DNA-binding transcriptional regulator, XRE-family HTH domain [Pseudomonas pohangensis]|jgi:DNA-binding XRE family transcriptional regulator|uniref:DNA-binding transcriptional regulator, XRE-family HTH domain n=1 Tax=Pseudomonas pohangensis TaxID=364197 RepID=A0A1H2EGQ6_9PSED|nr:helix-turn-helix transcriptional regulator [Pseudomonas pohangensis]SDT93898.1 DNA-binding transcriptional regulator, XRE-family HTH domain [Pseudomonas pohangensis]
MNVQVIMREGQPEYAVLPWLEYQALLQAAGNRREAVPQVKNETRPALASLSELSALRQSRAISLEDLARSAGISPHYLAMIEKGERVAEGPIARALAQSLGVAGWEDGQ